MNDEHLAIELLKEMKATSKRWFIAFLVVLILWFSTIGVFVWYVSLPTEETKIDQKADDSSYNQVIGGDYNGGKTDDNTQEESGQSEKNNN